MLVLISWKDFRAIQKLRAGILKTLIFRSFSASRILKIVKNCQILTFDALKMTEKSKFSKSPHATFLLP